jgi:hypothetical protein
VGQLLDHCVKDDIEACDGVAQRIGDLETQYLHARYEISRALHTVRYRSPNRTAQRGLARLSQKLGLDESTLRRWARVSEVIQRDEFASIIHLRNPHGLPLTWSHIERLTRLRNREERRAAAAQAALGNWSACELSRRIRTRART